MMDTEREAEMNELLYHATQSPNLTPEEVGEILDLEHAMQDNHIEDRCTDLERQLRLARAQADDLSAQLQRSWEHNANMIAAIREALALGNFYDRSEVERLIKQVEESKHVG